MQMLRRVLKNINQRVPDLARRPQRSCVVPVRPDTAAPSKGVVDGLRDADGETLNSAREDALPAIGLDDQMHMVPLHTELEDAEGRARRTAEGVLHLPEYMASAQRRQPAARS